jgi:hypothetical protein
VLGPIDAALTQVGAQQLLAAEHVQRQVAVAVVVAVEEAPLLLAMQRVVGGVKVQHQFLGRSLEAGDELLDQHLVQSPGAVARSAHFSRRHSVGALATSRSTPTAVCIATSWRSAPWSFRSSQPSASHRRAGAACRARVLDQQRVARIGMQRAAASINPSLRSAAQQHHPAIAGHAAAVKPALYDTSAKAAKFDLAVPNSSVQFGIGSPVL